MCSDISHLGSEHLSLYTLTIEPNSRFFATQMKLDDDEKLAAHYDVIGAHSWRNVVLSNTR